MFNDGANQVTTSYGYNKRRLPTAERLQWGSVDWTLGYRYDGNGQLSGQTYPNGLSVDYAPNALGQATRAGAYATGVSYYPNGAMKQFTYGNGIVHTLGQNARGLPDRSRDAFGTAGYLDDSYDYDANGNVAAISDGLSGNRGNRDMTYDGLDRLLTASSPMFNGTVARYSYDVLDNLRTVQAPGRNQVYVYDANWRLTNVADAASGATVIGLGYDPRGNLANKNGVSFVFDLANRLRSVDGSSASNYLYDGQGRRVQDLTSGAKRSIYSLSGQLLYDDNQRTGIKSDYIYLNGSLVARDSDAIALGSPVLTAPGNDTTGSYTVQWSALANATSYTLQEQFNGGAWVSRYTGSQTSYPVQGNPVGTYGYRVRGCVDTVCGSWSAVATVVESLPAPAPASAPALTAPATAPNGAYSVAWTAVNGASSYTLEQSANGGAWSVAYNGAGLQVDYTAKASGSYAYRVKACNSTGCGPVSATSTVQVVYPPTSAPALTVPATSYTGAYTISWTAVSTATSYTLEESANGAPWVAVYTGAALSKAFSAMATGSHAYRVKACNVAGCGAVSATGTVQVTYPPASAPALTTPATNTTGSYTVSWTAVSTATSYTLQESVNGGAWATLQSGASRSRAISGKWDGSYAYRVQACNVGGCGPFSATQTTTVTIPPPATPTLTVASYATAGTPYALSWSAPLNATSYTLQESANGGAWTTVYAGSATSVTRTNATGSYGYRVAACNAKGCSAYSAAQTVVVERNACSTCLLPGGDPSPGQGNGKGGG